MCVHNSFVLKSILLMFCENEYRSVKMNICPHNYRVCYTTNSSGKDCSTVLLSNCEQHCTHVKNSQLVTSLQTSRQQVVFAWLVTSCQQVWNKLLTTCNNLVDIIRLVTRLFQQSCYNHDITILLQPCVVKLVTFLLYHDCIRLVRTTL